MNTPTRPRAYVQTCSAAAVYRVFLVKPHTLRKWVERGHVQRVGYDQYDVDSLRKHLLRRAANRRSPDQSTP